MKTPKQDDVVCPQPKCGGLLFDVTPLLAAAIGVKHVQCDKCKQKWAIKIGAAR